MSQIRWTGAALLAAGMIIQGGCSSGGGTPAPQFSAADYAPIAAAKAPAEAYIDYKARAAGITPAAARAMDDAIDTRRNPFNPKDRSVMGVGHVVYDAHCANCHGPGGDGKGSEMRLYIPEMDFTTSKKKIAVTMGGGAPYTWFAKVSEGVVSKTANPDGTHPAMPAFRDLLTREQIWLSISYIEAIARGNAPRASDAK